VIAMNGQIGEVEPAQENGDHRDAIVFTLFDRVRIAADLAHDENAEMRHAWIGIQARKDGDGCELADAHRDGDMDGLEAIREDTHTESAFNASCRERDGGIARLIAPRRAIAQSAVVCASVESEVHRMVWNRPTAIAKEADADGGSASEFQDEIRLAQELDLPAARAITVVVIARKIVTITMGVGSASMTTRQKQ